MALSVRRAGPVDVLPLLRLPADPVSASLVRDAVRRWLQALAWPEDQRVEMVLAASEAASNCIQHAYPAGTTGLLEVRGECRTDASGRGRRLHLTVWDFGSWPRLATTASGGGLRTIRACVDTVEIRRTAFGTLVTLISKAVPATRQ